MKRKRLPPDKRLDWRDPNMPVLRKTVQGKLIRIGPKTMQEYYHYKMLDHNYDTNFADWKRDSSYNWGKKKK